MGTKLRCEEFLDELAQLNGRDDCIPLLDYCHFHVFLVVQRMRVYEIDIRGFFKNILYFTFLLAAADSIDQGGLPHPLDTVPIKPTYQSIDRTINPSTTLVAVTY